MKKLSKIFAVIGSLLMVLYFNTASADTNPFAKADQVQTIASDDGKCGDSKDSKKEEGKCGDNKAKAKKDGKCGEGKCGDKKGKEEGKCGDKKGKEEGKCGDKKGKEEGKCGEGKCGGK